MREFRTFSYRGASYRISPADGGPLFSDITEHIKSIRDELEHFIKKQPVFLTSLVPIELLPGAPEPAVLMAEAAKLTGTGPMAAVAGTIAMLAVQRAAAASAVQAAEDIIIENGGDIFILPLPGRQQNRKVRPVIAGVFSGISSKFSGLALKIIPDEKGTAVCSSSGRMGHSLSLGDCDLCTVVSGSAALADAAATLGGNLVKKESDLGPAAERLVSIPGIDGVLLIKNEQIAVAGKLPEIIRHTDADGLNKITGTFLV